LHKENLLFFQSSPPPFCPDGRTIDSDAIVDVIDKADQFVYIAVMDYFYDHDHDGPLVLKRGL
jgi:hypothetical protein